MTEISEAAKAKAEELVASHWGDCPPGMPGIDVQLSAFARFIQQVSDAAKSVLVIAGDKYCANGDMVSTNLAPFILPDPVDPLLVEAREIAAKVCRGALTPGKEADNFVSAILRGERDEPAFSGVSTALAALRRGMELAQEQQS